MTKELSPEDQLPEFVLNKWIKNPSKLKFWSNYLTYFKSNEKGEPVVHYGLINFPDGTQAEDFMKNRNHGEVNINTFDFSLKKGKVDIFGTQYNSDYIRPFKRSKTKIIQYSIPGRPMLVHYKDNWYIIIAPTID